MAPEPTARCRRLRLLAYSSSGVNARGVSNFLQLPGYSARDGLLPCGDGRRDGEVGCRSRHPDTTLRQTADPRMRWTIGGANAILALRSPSLGVAAESTPVSRRTPALVLPRLPALGSHDGGAWYTDNTEVDQLGYLN